jgi:hypothetical protein
MQHDEHLPANARAEIRERVIGILDSLRYLVRSKEVDTFDDLREAVDDMPYDETAAIDLSVQDCVTLIDIYAEDVGVEKIEVPADELATKIEEIAAQIVCHFAIDEARELVDGLENLCDEFGFDASDLRPENEYGMFAHAREDEPADDCVVYQYRNVESEEVHVNVWEYTFPGTDFKLYLNEEGEADEMTHSDRTSPPV